MRMKNTLVQFVYRTVWVIIAIVATVFTIIDHIPALNGDGINPALHYTCWSVWLALLTAGLVYVDTTMRLVKKQKEGYNKFAPLVKMSANIMVIATFIVAAFVLPNKIWMEGYWSRSSIFTHFLLPIFTVMDSVLFDPRNRYRVSYPFISVITSLIYWTTIVIRICVHRNACGGHIPSEEYDYWYPYGFTNFDEGHTLGGLCGMLAGILAGLIIIGFIFWIVDKLHKEDGKIKFDPSVNEDEMTDIIHLIKTSKNK